MFGTLRPDSLEGCLRDRYQQDFCGACRAMASQGRLWSLATSYDIAFLHVLLSSLSEAPRQVDSCTALPWRRVNTRTLSPALQNWLSSLNLLLIREKFRDDVADEGSWKGRLGLRVVSSKEEGALKTLEHSGFPLALLTELSLLQSETERVEKLHLEEYAQPFVSLMGEVFAQAGELTGRRAHLGPLRHVGQSLAFLIYLGDAQKDRVDDEKRGRFNALNASSNATAFRAIQKRESRRLQSHLSQLPMPAEERATLSQLALSLTPSSEFGPKPRSPRRRLKKAGICELLLCSPECLTLFCHCGGCECCAYGASEVGEQLKTSASTVKPALPCPACGNDLTENTYEGVAIDECGFCRGLWLDRGELELLAQKIHLLPNRLTTPIVSRHINRRPEGTRPCPRCGHFLQSQSVNGVRLDLCSDCQGMWLDQGELNRLLL